MPLYSDETCEKMTSDDLHILTHVFADGVLNSCIPLHSLSVTVVDQGHTTEGPIPETKPSKLMCSMQMEAKT